MQTECEDLILLQLWTLNAISKNAISLTFVTTLGLFLYKMGIHFNKFSMEIQQYHWN